MVPAFPLALSLVLSFPPLPLPCKVCSSARSTSDHLESISRKVQTPRNSFHAFHSLGWCDTIAALRHKCYITCCFLSESEWVSSSSMDKQATEANIASPVQRTIVGLGGDNLTQLDAWIRDNKGRQADKEWKTIGLIFDLQIYSFASNICSGKYFKWLRWMIRQWWKVILPQAVTKYGISVVTKKRNSSVEKEDSESDISNQGVHGVKSWRFFRLSQKSFSVILRRTKEGEKTFPKLNKQPAERACVCILKPIVGALLSIFVWLFKVFFPFLPFEVGKFNAKSFSLFFPCYGVGWSKVLQIWLSYDKF